MLKLALSRDAGRFLAALDAKPFRQIVNKAFSLMSDPIPADSSKLTGANDLWRADSGEYRVVYLFDDEVLCVEVVGKRNDNEVYRAVERLN